MSYDSKCYELAEHFFGTKDRRLQEIAQAIQDTVETFPSEEPSRYCAYCTKRLQMPFYAVVLDADRKRVRVHKQCIDGARRFWHPPTASESDREVSSD